MKKIDRRRILVAGKFHPPQKEEEKKGGRSMMFSKTQIAIAIYFSSFAVKIFHLLSIAYVFLDICGLPIIHPPSPVLRSCSNSLVKFMLTWGLAL
jgi:hypothetical protein